MIQKLKFRCAICWKHQKYDRHILRKRDKMQMEVRITSELEIQNGIISYLGNENIES